MAVETRGAAERRLWLLAEWAMVGKDGVGEVAVCGSHASWDRKCLSASIVDSPGQLVLAAKGSAANRTVASWLPC